MKEYEKMTVGQIVADNFSNARIFNKYGIDFCCNGSDSLAEACRKGNIQITDVLNDLESPHSEIAEEIEFKEWPLDLLCDYILKFHHRNIRKQGPDITKLFNKICNVHGEQHPELHTIRNLFIESLDNLYEHLEKEEQVLFPYIYLLYDADVNRTSLPPFHCGSISAPISVMMTEHQAEGERYHEIAALSNNYQTPADGCDGYRLLMGKLRSFDEALHQHIHLENNIVFPESLRLEEAVRKNQ